MKLNAFLITSLALTLVSCSNVSSVKVSDNATSEQTAREIIFGDSALLNGKIEQIKTYDGEGRAVFVNFLYTSQEIIVRPSETQFPENANESVDGMEIKMINGNDGQLEQFIGKNVTVKGSVSGGLDLHCFGFGFFVDSLRDVKTH